MVDYPAFIGQTFTLPDPYEVGVEQIRSFAKSVRNFDPIHHSEEAAKAAGHPTIVAPPTFASIIGLLVQELLTEQIIKDYDPSQMVQAESKFTFHRLIYARDRMECSVKMLNMRQSVGVDIVETEAIGRDWETKERIITGYVKVAGYHGAVMEESMKQLVRNVMMHGRSIF